MPQFVSLGNDFALFCDHDVFYGEYADWPHVPLNVGGERLDCEVGKYLARKPTVAATKELVNPLQSRSRVSSHIQHPIASHYPDPQPIAAIVTA